MSAAVTRLSLVLNSSEVCLKATVKVLLTYKAAAATIQSLC